MPTEGTTVPEVLHPDQSNPLEHRIQLTIPTRAAPPLPQDPSGKLAELIATWERIIAPVPPGGSTGDAEDWLEMAFRLHDALNAFGPQRVLVRRPGGWTQPEQFIDGATGCTVPTPPAPLPDFGIVMGGHHAPSPTAAGALASRYMTLETFTRHAGRRVELAGVEAGEHHDAHATIDRMRATGIDRIYVKGCATKTLNVVVEADQTLDEALADGNDWALVNLDGTRASLLIQEWVPMRYEYRIYVVAHEPVTGAGAVLEHTPLDNGGSPFDSVVRERREDLAPGFGGPTQSLPEVVSALVAFARQVAAELEAEVPEMADYVLDVALGSDGRPLVVELNSIENCGFFACQPTLIFEALRAEHLDEP